MTQGTDYDREREGDKDVERGRERGSRKGAGARHHCCAGIVRHGREHCVECTLHMRLDGVLINVGGDLGARTRCVALVRRSLIGGQIWRGAEDVCEGRERRVRQLCDQMRDGCAQTRAQIVPARCIVCECVTMYVREVYACIQVCSRAHEW